MSDVVLFRRRYVGLCGSPLTRGRVEIVLDGRLLVTPEGRGIRYTTWLEPDTCVVLTGALATDWNNPGRPKWMGGDGTGR